MTVASTTIVAMPRVIALAPHPDDEAYAFGGTLRLLANAGWTCEVLLFTDGEAGKRHDGGHPDAVRTARVNEALASCALLGASARFLNLPDGGLTDESLGGYVDTLLADFRSMGTDGIVLSLGSDGAYGHPDHLAVYRMLLVCLEALGSAAPAALLASFPPGLFLPQYERCRDMMGDPPQPPPEAIGSDSFDVAVDIGKVAGTKLAAIGAHRTQLPGGQAHALFPPGIVASLLNEERFSVLYPEKLALPREISVSRR